MEILLGADPEVFITKDGVPHSAHGLIPGTKKRPKKVKDGALQVDGMAGEFNINPAKTQAEFVHNTQSVLSQLAMQLPAGHAILIQPSVKFDKAHFEAQPQVAKMLGCDPDFNAYTRHANKAPDNNTTMRTAAGHVHVGWGKGFDIDSADHLAMCWDLVKQLDLFLGVPSVLLDKDGAERRRMYGKAGCFRPKPYGCEYRVLSNFWLKSPELMQWVFDQTMLAVKELMNGKKWFAGVEYDVVDVINGGWDIKYFQKNHSEHWKKINTFEHLLPK